MTFLRCLQMSVIFWLQLLLVPPFANMKETQISCWREMILWDNSLPSSRFACLLNKVTFLAPTSCLLTYWPVVQQAEGAGTQLQFLPSPFTFSFLLHALSWRTAAPFPELCINYPFLFLGAATRIMFPSFPKPHLLYNPTPIVFIYAF